MRKTSAMNTEEPPPSKESATPAASAPASRLNLRGATMLVIGSMIGSGIFVTSAESARLVGSPGWLLAAWALAGVMTITGALCCAELAVRMPAAGGQYVYLREAYHPLVGFLFGWALLLVIQTGTIAAVAVAFAIFLGVLLPAVSATNFLLAPVAMGHYAISLSTQQLTAIAMILALTWINTRGLKIGKWIQNSFTFAKISALIGLIVLGLTVGWNTKSAAFTSSWWNPWANGWHSQAASPGLAATGTFALLMLLGRAMTGPLFAQSAWNNVTFVGGEMENPERNLPRSLLRGCGVVIALYLLANIAYIVTLPLKAIQAAPNDRVAGVMMEAILGKPGTSVMAIAILISTFGCNNGLILAGARVYQAMAKDGLFFEGIRRENARKAPANALLVQGAWAAFLTLPRTVETDPKTGAVIFGNVYTELLKYIVSMDLLFYALMVGAVIVFRWKDLREKQEGSRAKQGEDVYAKQPYKTWGYPVTPAIYLCLALLLILDLGYLDPIPSRSSYLLVLSGVPIYLLWNRRRSARH